MKVLVPGLTRIALAVALIWLATPIAPGSTAEPDGPGGSFPTGYRVVFAARGREARTRLAQAGVPIDWAGDESVIAVLTAVELARVQQQGIRPLSVTPLDFPDVDSAYHNYAEMRAALKQARDAHPEIVALAEIGQSLEGRLITAVKISDHPELDEPQEPALLFTALHHGREHLTVEMALDVVRIFTEGYGTDPALTNLVNQREIWVIPMVNPDGGEFDIATGSYQFWRKNRRFNSDGSIGVDLNRNYGYGWGGEGSNSWPSSETYRGAAAFSEPETQVIRDFATAHGNLAAALNFHSSGERILYPFGHTVGGAPPAMDATDRAAFEALADRMAGTNGYRPGQACDLYSVSGDACDWLYAERGAFCFTFEIYPATVDFYPPGSIIDRETHRNDAAVAYLTAMADNPRKAAGDGGDVTPPSVSLAVAVGLPLAGLPLTLTAAAQDDVGVTLVGWQADGESIGMTAEPPFSLTWTKSTPGVVVLQALAFDAGGNVGASAPVTVSLKAQTYFPMIRR